MNGRARSRVTSCLIFLLAVLFVRGGFLFSRSTGLSDDPDAYRVIAETLSQTGVFGLPMGEATSATNELARPSAFRPPLYPWLLSWLVGDDGKLANTPVAVLHGLFGVLTIGLTWDIARRLISVRAAWISAGLVLIDPILLWQSTLVMTETIATLLVVMVWWWWVVRIAVDDQDAASRERSPTRIMNAFVLGGLLLLAILCRPTFLVWAAMILASMVWVGPVCRVRRAAMIGVTTVVIALGIGVWTLRNVTAVGYPVWGTTHGGYTLLLANNDSFYDYLETRPWQLPWRNEAWDASDFFTEFESLPRSGDERADDRVAYDAARSTIADRPEIFWYSCWVRLTRLWQPFPHATGDRSTASILAVGLFHSFVYLMVFAAMVRHRGAFHPRQWHPRQWHPRRWRSHLGTGIALWPAIALVVTLSGVHAVYWSNPRMRSPAIPVIAIAAAAIVGRKESSCSSF